MLHTATARFFILCALVAVSGGPAMAAPVCTTDQAGCQGRAILGNVDGSAPRYFTIFYARGGIKNLVVQPEERTPFYVYEGDMICIGMDGNPPDLDLCKRMPIPVEERDDL